MNVSIYDYRLLLTDQSTGFWADVPCLDYGGNDRELITILIAPRSTLTSVISDSTGFLRLAHHLETYSRLFLESR